MSHVGNVLRGDFVPIPFNTGTSAGASTDLTVDGTIVLYRLTSGTAVAVATSPHPAIIFSESVGGSQGPNLVFIDTSNSICIPGRYGVVVQGATVGPQTGVSGFTGSFSIQWEYTPGLIYRNYVQVGDASHIRLNTDATFADDMLKGATVILASGTGFGQARVISGYGSSSRLAAIDPPLATPADTTTLVEIVATPPENTVVLPQVEMVKAAGITLRQSGTGGQRIGG